MSFIYVAANISMVLLICSVVLVLIRLFRGPSIEDRIVALDVLSVIGIAIISVYSVLTQTPLLIDIGIMLAILSFIGTVALAYYLHKGLKKNV
ncbi:MAG: cation:proton antiporter [Chlorobiaceae bacterium]|nr:cation:proton antiporter [Chlorobiaceae bacterium]MBA4310217.1 cation:proton antiporter [Chlorobiaceae bacterium]